MAFNMSKIHVNNKSEFNKYFAGQEEPVQYPCIIYFDKDSKVLGICNILDAATLIYTADENTLVKNMSVIKPLTNKLALTVLAYIATSTDATSSGGGYLSPEQQVTAKCTEIAEQLIGKNEFISIPSIPKSPEAIWTIKVDSIPNSLQAKDVKEMYNATILQSSNAMIIGELGVEDMISNIPGELNSDNKLSSDGKELPSDLSKMEPEHNIADLGNAEEHILDEERAV